VTGRVLVTPVCACAMRAALACAKMFITVARELLAAQENATPLEGVSDHERPARFLPFYTRQKLVLSIARLSTESAA